MNETSPKKNLVSSEGQLLEMMALKSECPTDTLKGIFSQIYEIQRGEEGGNLDGMLDELAERLELDAIQIEAVKAKVHFIERKESIAKKWKDAKVCFDDAARKALLPVFASFALQGAPALAEEAVTDRSVRKPEVILLAPSELSELKEEKLFDLDSPLTITGENMKKQELLPQELAVLKDLHRRVWTERNEWAVSSGEDRKGNFTAEVLEGESDKVRVPWSMLEKSKTRKSLTHTHPIAAVTFFWSFRRSNTEWFEKTTCYAAEQW